MSLLTLLDGGWARRDTPLRWRSRLSVESGADAFEDHLPQRSRIPQPFQGVQDFDARQAPFGIVVGCDAFAEVLGGDGRLPEPEVQRVDLAVVGNPCSALARSSPLVPAGRALALVCLPTLAPGRDQALTARRRPVLDPGVRRGDGILARLSQ